MVDSWSTEDGDTRAALSSKVATNLMWPVQLEMYHKIQKQNKYLINNVNDDYMLK